jgi:hypothetical protein
MVRVLFMLGLYAFVTQTGTSFTSQELSSDFLSSCLIFGHELLQLINNKIDKRRKESSRRSSGNVFGKNVIAVIFQLKYICQT